MPVFDDSIKTSLKSTKNIIFVNSSDDVAAFAKARTKMLNNLWTMDNTNPFTMLTVRDYNL